MKGLRERIKQKMTAKVIGKGMDQMGKAVEAFRADVGDVPCGVDVCTTCENCRERARKLQEAIDKYFAVYLKPKGGR